MQRDISKTFFWWGQYFYLPRVPKTLSTPQRLRVAYIWCFDQLFDSTTIQYASQLNLEMKRLCFVDKRSKRVGPDMHDPPQAASMLTSEYQLYEKLL